MPAMTAHKASNAGWLMFTARARFKLISGGADPDHDVRQAVRERLADGRLFPVDGVSVARRGSGQLCVVCGRVIVSADDRSLENPDIGSPPTPSENIPSPIAIGRRDGCWDWRTS